VQLFRHVLELEGYKVRPSRSRLDLPSHLSKLVPDNRMVDEELAEGFAAVGVVERVGVDDAALAEDAVDNTHALVVEVVLG
jgi:hypothetical protein